MGKISRWILGEISSEDWWNIREKVLNSTKIISLFYKYKYFRISKENCAFIPLSVKFSGAPSCRMEFVEYSSPVVRKLEKM